MIDSGTPEWLGTPAVAAVDGAAAIGTQVALAPEPEAKAPKKYVTLLTLAMFGNFMAIVAPIAFSLSVRTAQLEPAHQSWVGYAVSAGAFAGVVFGPIAGALSDRTRSRIGRRRPWIASCLVIGVAGLLLAALAPSFAVLIVGWCLAQLGLGTAQLQLLNTIADRVPEKQRGRVSGLTGVAQLIAGVFGAAVAASFVSNSVLLFLVPGGVGALLMLAFVIFIKEPDTRSTDFGPRPSALMLLKNYGFNVRKYSSFAWNWLGRFLFNFGVSLGTAFGALFFATRLGMGVAEIGGIVALSGLVGVVSNAVAAGFSGWLSDKVGRRKPFILASGFILAVGAGISAVASDVPLLMVGLFVLNFGLGLFFAVDQALYITILPERDTEAGRFVGINQFSTLLPQVIAPAVAPTLLLVGGTEASGNFGLLYIVAGAFAAVGGVVITLGVRNAK
ncbi:MFS transporter [Pseudarthrobacter sp. fls2-241-R2A-127]|uniref:MFS transporter n=1 Tax=Pseudarthrobacter sp. fls2-241-R2A-127 TaxID=3040303 RepID=UPI0025569C44|nr:MFS transporter [Pseudarthrobacter sp. fls2-241-R2A-127]